MKKIYLFFYLITFLTSFSFAQTVHITGPSGSESFGSAIINLPNGNFVVSDPLYDEAGMENIGAVYVYDGKTHQIISSVKGSQPKDNVGIFVYLVDDNKVLIHSPGFDGVRGALTLFTPEEGKHIQVSASNSLVGSQPNELSNAIHSIDSSGKYLLLRFPFWNGNRGAVISHAISKPFTGIISNNNAFVGTNQEDRIAHDVLFRNEFIIINSTRYSSSSGAVAVLTLENCRGEINPSNSLVGEAPGDQIGVSITFLKKERGIVVGSPKWSGGRGAATFINLENPIVGMISAENSLVGDEFNDLVGSGIYALENNNYVVASSQFHQARGAVTWGNGQTGVKGNISSDNSFIGERDFDMIGSSITPLPNGNYVVRSPNWSDQRGAATWADGNKKLTGTVSNTNSLVGQTQSDRIGKVIIDLSNGDYGVVSDNLLTELKATITWGDGQKGITGNVTPENSLLGLGDFYGTIHNLAFTSLTNGNGVLTYPDWNRGKGIAIFITKGNYPTGKISNKNALMGTDSYDRVGADKVVVLANNNFIIRSPKGALTWGHGTKGVYGEVSVQNSITGFKRNSIGEGAEVIALTNGNYVAYTNPLYNSGASVLTWGNGETGTIGEITPDNSLQGPDLSITSAVPLKNGNYAVISNQKVSKYTALTLVDGSKSISGTVSKDNSLIGYYQYIGLEPGTSPFHCLNDSNDFLFHNYQANQGKGSITWIEGNGGVIGEINDKNSVLGTSSNEGYHMIPTYNYTLKSMIVGRPKVNMLSIFKTEVVTGLDEIEETLEKQTILYPNPSSTFSALRSKKENMEIVTVKVIDQQGQVHFLQSGQISKHISLELMTQSLKPGIYHLEVTGSNYVEKHRLVKQ